MLRTQRTSGSEIVKVACGQFIKPLNLIYVGNRVEVHFGFNRGLIKIVKALEGARWHGYDDKRPRKIWTIANSQHNDFRIRYMNWMAQSLAYRKSHIKEDPYYIYDIPLVPFHSDRPLYEHQKELAALILTRHYCEFACEMGTGKTLAAIEAAEKAGMTTGDVWYVGPKAGCRAVPLELIKWSCNHDWRFFTYEGLVSYLKNHNVQAPKMFVIDEASKAKNPNAQRSQATAHVADAVRAEHGMSGYVVEMSGTPAPKDPSDWWHQIRIIAPGFLAEGSKEQFKRDLCLIEQREGMAGGSYPHLITWWDNENKCAKCGDLKEQHPGMGGDHAFIKSEDKVAKIYRRLKGLVVVKFKEECMDLPPKRHEIIDIMPTPETLRAAKMITKHTGHAAKTMGLLRQLSDGFQYIDVKVGDDECPGCKGKKTVMAPVPVSGTGGGPNHELNADDFHQELITCDLCGGKGTVPKYQREMQVVGSPKDDFFISELDEHEDVGRYIVWGGFQGTIDRLVDIAHKQGWSTLKIDGRGYIGETALGEHLDDMELLMAMDASFKNKKELDLKYQKLCVVGNPEAGGMALTLTASPTSLYYSNSFKGEARIQSEERGHRGGMPHWVHTIKDLVHLPTDQLVLDNLGVKKALQDRSMGKIKVSQEQILACFG